MLPGMPKTRDAGRVAGLCSPWASRGAAATSSSRSGSRPSRRSCWLPGGWPSVPRSWRSSCWFATSACRASGGIYGHMVIVALLGHRHPVLAHHLGRGEHRLGAGRHPERHRAALRDRVRGDGARGRADHPQPAGSAWSSASSASWPSPARASPHGLGGSLPGELALVGSAVSYGAAGVYARRAVPNLAPLPAHSWRWASRSSSRWSWRSPSATRWPPGLRPRRCSPSSGSGWSAPGSPSWPSSSSLAAGVPPATSMVAYVLPVVGGSCSACWSEAKCLGLPVLAGMVLIIAGVALANTRFGHRRLIGRREPPVPRAVPGVEGD